LAKGEGTPFRTGDWIGLEIRDSRRLGIRDSKRSGIGDSELVGMAYIQRMDTIGDSERLGIA